MEGFPHDTVCDFLYVEAALLDDRHFAAWLELFSDDGEYWIPNDPTATEPNSTLSLIYDDRSHLGERVWRLNSTYAHAQNPTSHTTHLVSNIRTLTSDDSNADVESAFAIHELRREENHVYSGRYRHRLVLVDGEIKIRSKRVDLIQAHAGLGNVSFLL